MHDARGPIRSGGPGLIGRTRGSAGSRRQRAVLLLAGALPLLVASAGRATPLAPPPQEWELKFMRVHSAVAPDPAAFNLGSSLTLETWIFLEGDSPQTMIMGKGHDAAGDNPWVAYGLTFGAGRRVQLAQSAGAPGSMLVAEAPAEIPLRTWTHLAGTLDGGVLTLFVNGDQVAQAVSPGAAPATSVPFALGGWPPSATPAVWGFLFGSLRQARVWNRALGGEEIRAFAAQGVTGSEPGLVACWPLDDGAHALMARDIGPGHRALDLHGQPGPNAEWVRTFVLDTGPYFTEDRYDLASALADGAPLDFDRDGAMDIVAEQIVWFQDYNAPLKAFRNDGTGHFTDVSDSVFTPAPPSIWGGPPPIVADFDGDGIADVFQADYGQDWDPGLPGQNLLLRGTSEGHLADVTATHLPQVLNKPHDAAAGDLRGLGLPDIFISNIGYPKAHLARGSELYLNDGHGAFVSDSSYLPPEARGYYTGSLFLDADKDGRADLWLGSGALESFPDKLLVNRGGGDLVLAPPWALPPIHGGDRWMSLYAHPADLDGDGWPDLVFDSILNYDNRTHLLRVLLNNGDGTFREVSDRIPQHGDFGDNGHCAVADLNGDGLPDVVAAAVLSETHGNHQSWLFLNVGRAEFIEASDLLRGDREEWNGTFITADFDGNSLEDLVRFGGDFSVVRQVKRFVAPVSWTRNFTIDPAPTKLFLRPGEGGALDAVLTSLNGFTGTVTVSAAFSPASQYVSASVPTASVALDGSAAVSVTVAPNTPLGVYWLWVNAESGGISHATSVPVIVYRSTTKVAPASSADPFVTSFSAGTTGFDGLKGAPTYEWDFGDESPHEAGTGATHSYAVAGSYSWSVTIRNGVAATSETGTVAIPWGCTVLGSAAASADSVAPLQPVVFTASAQPYFCGGAAVRYRWEFGDGAFSVEQNPTKRFGSGGTFPWTVTATAAGRSWTHSGWLNIAGLPQQAHALRFSGGQVAQAGLSPFLDLDATYTLEAWAYLPDLPGGGTILGRRWEDLGGDLWLSYALDLYPDGRPRFQQCGPTNASCSFLLDWTPVAVRRGLHLAVTSDGSNQTLFLDGAPLGGSPSPGLPGAAAVPFAIGAGAHPGGAVGIAPLDGILWDIRIWDHALSQQEIAESMTTRLTGDEPGLIAWWPLDDGAGQVAHDHGPHHLDLMLGTTPGNDAADPEWIDMASPCHVTCTAAANSAQGRTPVGVTFTGSAAAQGMCGDAPLVYDWDFGDGADHLTTAGAAHTYTASGTHTWRFTASAAGTSCTNTGTVVALPRMRRRLRNGR